jgi:hypothetical protein
MRRALALLICCAGIVHAQDAAPKFLKIRKAPGLELRWVDFGWSPEAFAAMETGARHPAASREWMLALLRVEEPVRFEGRTVPVGASLFVLVPKRGDKPLSVELRDVDVRDILFQENIIGTPPKEGERIASVPSAFQTVPEMVERLDMALTPVGNDTQLSIHYGNRRAVLMLKARE